jgi:hypothetical protein
MANTLFVLNEFSFYIGFLLVFVLSELVFPFFHEKRDLR